MSGAIQPMGFVHSAFDGVCIFLFGVSGFLRVVLLNKCRGEARSALLDVLFGRASFDVGSMALCLVRLPHKFLPYVIPLSSGVFFKKNGIIQLNDTKSSAALSTNVLDGIDKSLFAPPVDAKKTRKKQEKKVCQKSENTRS